ncbi:SdrD B-like domain-containing protein [Sphaerotilus uruguayifluvii]|uniref:SdrD B-like domain-containing protein n=1 Tax=Sphaerotilus uruguayifluvii TaxID=2735897 RepID=UPI001C2D26F4
MLLSGVRRSFPSLRCTALVLAAGLLCALPARAAVLFSWADSVCEGSTDGCLTNGTRRFRNVVPAPYSSVLQRDVLMTVVSTSNGAAPATPRAGFGSTASYIGGEVLGNSTPGAKSQVRFRLTFVTPGTSTPQAVPAPVFVTSLDTDGGYLSTPATGFRERIEFHGTTQAPQPGSQLEQTVALDGGLAYSPVLCSGPLAGGGCDSGAGYYVFYPGLSETTNNVEVSANYTSSLSTVDFSFGVEISSSAAGGYWESRQYGIQVGVPDGWVDVVPAFSGLPTAIRPGQTYAGLTLTCSNPAGTSAATATTCVPTVSAGTVGAVSCSPATPATVAAQGSVVCTFSYTAPGTQGGTDEPTTFVTFTGTTGASNDGNTANNVTTATAPLIDARDESTTTPYGTAASLSVLANDTHGSSAATLSNVTLSALGAPTSGASFDPSTGQFSVPAGAAPGSYSVSYQICANPALTPAVCDTAIATIVVTAADLSPAFSGLPTLFEGGRTYSGLTLTCTNAAGSATASAATCVPTASVGTIASTVCTPAVPATVAAAASIVCTFDYTAPPAGTASSVTLTGTTGASNDAVASNNTTTAQVPLREADLSPVFSGLPKVVAPGQTYSGLTLTCTNAAGGATAQAPLCAPSVSTGTISGLSCSPAGAATLAAGAAITCTFSYTAPGTQGGSDEPTTALVFTGTTGASNDSVASNNTTQAPATLIDAVDDVEARRGGLGGQTSRLDANDQFPDGSTFTRTGGSCANASVSTAGTATYDVPASGSCTVTYRVCAPALDAASCDTATLTVTATATSADLSVTIGGLPSAASPGATVTGTLTCTNAGPDAALQATCTGGAGVTTSGCSVDGSPVTLPLASLAAGSAIRCGITMTAPASGVLNVPASTGASNDVNGANNSALASVPVIDAVDDGTVTVPPTGSTVVLTGNDTLGGSPVAEGARSVALVDAGGLGGASIDASGRLVVPSGTAAGRYTVTYRLCTLPASVPAACDTATVVVDIAGEPDLTVSKSHAPATLVEGQGGRYTIVARNASTGSATSASYTVVDTLPAGMTVASVPTGAGWDCSATRIGAGVASCTSSQVLAAGSEAPAITLDVIVSAEACATPDASGLCGGSAAPVNRVSISGGGEVSSRLQSNNSYQDPTPVQRVGSVSGRAWLDADHDRAQGSGERGVAGLRVEVIDASGTQVATATTDASGDYRVQGLTAGSYTIRFRDPATGSYYGRPISKDPAGGNDPSADASTGVVASGVISGVAVSAGTTRINQSLPLDPAGVVYDSSSRAALGGVAVELLDAGGQAVPGGCLIGGTNQVTTSGSGALAGAYSFLLINPPPAGCPGAAAYQLRVTPTAGYAASGSIPAQAGTLVPPTGCTNGAAGGVCTVQAQAAPPSGSESTAYYLSVRLDPVNGPDIINNHIPLDPSAGTGLLVIKTGDRTQAEIGDSVRYSITVRRTDSGGATLPAVEIIDTLPAGFRYIAGTAMVDGRTIADPGGLPGPVLRFQVGALAAGGSHTLSYRVRIGVGAQQGTGINRAQATGTPGANCSAASDGLCSNVSQFRVRVTGGVFGAEACVVGRVFVDCNHDHVQGPEEPGIPGVRFYLSDGTSLISDVEGKYSVCGLAPRTAVMVVDGSTLPRGSRLTTSSNRNAGDAASLFLDLKNGELHRADFIEGSCSNTVLEQVKARRARGETQSLDTEKKGGRVLKFDGRPVTAPAQATDSARQRGTAAGQGEPGAVKPRQAAGSAGPAGARTETTETLREPVSRNPASSGATVPALEEGTR